MPSLADALPGTLSNPPLAVGLNGLHDWSTAQPFLDHFKMARPWSGTISGQFGARSFEALQQAGAVDAQGWLVAVPPGVDWVSTVLLTGLYPGARDLADRYQMTWTGTAELELLGGRNLLRDGNRIEFDYDPALDRMIELRIHALTSPLRDIRVVQLDNAARLRAGGIFRCEWLDAIRNYRLLRFMDWMATNGSAQRGWQGRPRVDDAFYTWRGAPVEVMLALVAEVGADPWFCIPHRADAGWIEGFARQISTSLRPGLTAWYEYSNEVWNFGFEQARWAVEQARGRWPSAGDGFMQLYAARAVEMAAILDRVHAGSGVGHVKVISTQTHWLGLEEAVLNAPEWQAENPLQPPPYRHFDAYAVSGYFEGGLSADENVARVRALLAQGGEAQARTALRDQLLSGGWPNSGRTIANLRETWDHHARVAGKHGLRLVMYEGGPHIVLPDEVAEDAALAAFYERFAYSAEIAQVQAAALDEWRAAGGEQFNLFVECAGPSRYGYWGLQRHLGDENPRWAAVEAWNASHDGPEGRDGAFIGPADLTRCAPG
ncbi:hypothetical protein GL279_02060 [Paracoccus limosus]|uniref:Cellulose-binding protein n=1 Tax=Paracoccus limosus TaxID=913252 RepID=A0A844GXM5_9RHOB|nr:hypothetical protein [Paracoccus limosus]MTH33379.1 hypothetical protein [Paracoccus limosus]